VTLLHHYDELDERSLYIQTLSSSLIHLPCTRMKIIKFKKNKFGLKLVGEKNLKKS